MYSFIKGIYSKLNLCLREMYLIQDIHIRKAENKTVR